MASHSPLLSAAFRLCSLTHPSPRNQLAATCTHSPCPMAERMCEITRGAVCPQYSPFSSNALTSTKRSFLRIPYALRKRNMRRARVVLPTPGLPVRTIFRQQFCSTDWLPPFSTYRTLPRISSNHDLAASMPVIASISLSSAARRLGCAQQKLKFACL